MVRETSEGAPGKQGAGRTGEACQARKGEDSTGASGPEHGDEGCGPCPEWSALALCALTRTTFTYFVAACKVTHDPEALVIK